jgi:predicted O-linked N-acetylglucosamine transferase (SPINDLY family)
MEYHRGYATGAMHWASQQKYTGYQPENRDPHRKLRIGFVSGDFRAHHPVDFFFRPVWASLDRDKFESLHIIVRHLMRVIAERIIMKALLQDGGKFSTPAR